MDGRDNDRKQIGTDCKGSDNDTMPSRGSGIRMGEYVIARTHPSTSNLVIP